MVRCEDCQHYQKGLHVYFKDGSIEADPVWYCDKDYSAKESDSHCADGERRREDG